MDSQVACSRFPASPRPRPSPAAFRRPGPRSPRFRALAFPGTASARFTATARQTVTVRQDGPDVLLTVAGYADRQAGRRHRRV